GRPVVTSVAIAPDSLTASTKLTATPTGSDTFGGTVTFTYQWRQDGHAIAGATSATLDLTKLTVKAGDTFRVQVTPHNGSAKAGATFTSKGLIVASTS